MFTLKLIGGRHTMEDGTVIIKGTIIKTSVPLHTIFVRKFERIYQEESVHVMPEAPNIPTPHQPRQPEKIELPRSLEKADYGKDVTKNFPMAAEADMQVFKDSEGYVVVDPDTGEAVSLFGLKKKEVNPFLDGYLEDVVEDD